MNNLLLVGLGGFLGAISRYLLSGAVQTLSRQTTFPYGTLVVNVLGCLLIGFLSFLAGSRGLLTAEWRFLLLVGFLGAFTTFSTFGHESWQLLQNGHTNLALLSMGGNMLLGLAAVWLGQWLAGGS